MFFFYRWKAFSQLTQYIISMFKKFFIFIGTFALAVGCATIDSKPDPFVGVWDYELHYLPQGEPLGIMTITQTNDGYSVSLNENSLKDVAFEGNALVSGYFIGQGYHVDVKGTFDGNNFEGMIDAEGNTFRMTAVKQE